MLWAESKAFSIRVMYCLLLFSIPSSKASFFDLQVRRTANVGNTFTFVYFVYSNKIVLDLSLVSG